MTSNSIERINLELTSSGGEIPQDLTTQLANPIRVFTHPFRLKLSSLTLRQDSVITELPMKYELMIRKNPHTLIMEGTEGHTTSVRSLGTFEKTLELTEDIAKNFRILSQYFRYLPFHGEFHDQRPHYHLTPEFVYDGKCVLMRFPDENIDFAESTDQVYIRFLNSKLAEMLGVSLTTLNEKLMEEEKKEHIFENIKLQAYSDLYVYCNIAAHAGYKDLPSDLIRVVRVPKSERLVHINFDDDLWVPGEQTQEIKKITIKQKDFKAQPWNKANVDWAVTLTLEGNLYKTNRVDGVKVASE